MQMELLHHPLYLAEIAVLYRFWHDWLCGGRAALFDRADQQVLRRVREVDKLQNLRLIAAALQEIRADGVRRQRREPFLYDAVTRQKRIVLRLDLPVQFMLAAGH